jgi:hypothetical protein
MLPIAVIQHPLGGLKADEVYERARGVIDAVQHLLTTPRRQLLAALGEAE